MTRPAPALPLGRDAEVSLIGNPGQENPGRAWSVWPQLPVPELLGHLDRIACTEVIDAVQDDPFEMGKGSEEGLLFLVHGCGGTLSGNIVPPLDVRTLTAITGGCTTLLRLEVAEEQAMFSSYENPCRSLGLAFRGDSALAKARGRFQELR